ncbi:MAG TPA: type II and III secretion system protein [Bryobacteraceae bacterium]|nr:type II and III secretion system protein [Bryobacteraceae bacterium]
MKLCTSKPRCFTAWFLSAALAWSASTAEQLFQQGQKAERAGDPAKAYTLYLQAAAAEPDNLKFWSRVQALRPVAGMLDVKEAKAGGGLSPQKLDSTLFGHISDRELDEARKPLPPAGLKVAIGARDYDLHGDSKSLWEQMAAILHLGVTFDTQYQPTHEVHFELTGADYRTALRALEAATNSFLTPVTDRTILVANDSTQKRTEFERTAVVVIPFPEAETVQELQELATSVRGVLDIQRLMVDNARKLIVVRDRVAKVRLAERILQDLLRSRAQVSIEVQLLTTDISSTTNWGLSPQTAFPLLNFLNKPNLLSSIPSGYTNFLAFGGGASIIGIGVTTASLLATVTKGHSETVLESQIVAQDGQAATLHVGDRYPIVTNQYIGNTTGGQVFAPPPTFNYEDLGLVLKVTPHIHGVDEVTLDVSTEFKLLEAASLDGIPVISNKKYESKVRVVEGQWAVLAGLLTQSDMKSISGIPVMSLIPFLRNNTTTRDTGETLVVLKPHITILPPTEYPTWRAWTGTETKLLTDF